MALIKEYKVCPECNEHNCRGKPKCVNCGASLRGLKMCKIDGGNDVVSVKSNLSEIDWDDWVERLKVDKMRGEIATRMLVAYYEMIGTK